MSDFLVWISTAAGASGIVAWIAEQIPAFQDLPSKAKWWIMLVSSVVLALIGWSIMTFVPAEVLKMLEAPFQVVVGIVLVFLSNQFFHKVDPNKAK